MTKTEPATTVISDGRSPDRTSARRRSGRSQEAGVVPSSLMIFMDAANNINGQDFTVDNVRNYTLRKFNVDVTKNILSSRKPTTRAEIRAERMRMGTSRTNEQKGTARKEPKRKFEPSSTLGSPAGGSKKKNVGREQIAPASTMDDGRESLEVQQGAGDVAENPDGVSRVVNVEKQKARGSFLKNVKNSPKEVESRNPAVGQKKKIVGRVKFTPASRDEGQQSLAVQQGAGDNTENPDGESRVVNAENQKAKGSYLKNVKNSPKEVESRSPAVGPRKKIVGRVKFTPASRDDGQQSLEVQEGAGDNSENPDGESKAVMSDKQKAKGSSRKNVENSLKEIKSQAVAGSKKKSVVRLKIPPASLEGDGSQQVRDEQVGESAGNSENKTKMAKVVKSKARGRPKKNAQTTVVHGKKRKAEKA